MNKIKNKSNVSIKISQVILIIYKIDKAET